MPKVGDRKRLPVQSASLRHAGRSGRSTGLYALGEDSGEHVSDLIAGKIRVGGVSNDIIGYLAFPV